MEFAPQNELHNHELQYGQYGDVILGFFFFSFSCLKAIGKWYHFVQNLIIPSLKSFICMIEATLL